jgi:ABC-type lipoprotein export system ATPase subunit
MPACNITVSSAIVESPRVQQIRGIFDLTEEKTSSQSWQVNLPLEERDWKIGLITGPSGCGKSTIARRLWPDEIRNSENLQWSADQTLLDGFPEDLGIKEVVALLSSVGFSSPPAWLRPYGVLSTGQKFRVSLARLLAESHGLVVVDEFTSVVDRTIAQVGSAALAKTVRGRDGQRFVAVSCHDDIIPWLNPDWVYRPAENDFSWRFLQRRPAITLEVFRVHASAWALFRPHHYLNHSLNNSGVCFLALWHDRPVAFSAWLHFCSPGPPTKREHRTVTLPDFQGVGIGNKLSAMIASMWTGLGFRATSTTTHPAMIAARVKSGLWMMTRSPSMDVTAERNIAYAHLKHSTTRLTAGFQYVGKPMSPALARRLLGR